jgi:hypothetical protein
MSRFEFADGSALAIFFFSASVKRTDRGILVQRKRHPTLGEYRT